MNERRKELITQAGGYWNYGDFNMSSSVEFQEQDIAKLAELIVRECVKVMYDNAIERKVPPDINQTPTHYAIAVLEHFGVEE